MRGYTLDLRRLLRDLGGPAEVHRRLVQMGFDVKKRTVAKWNERGDIAIPYLVNLLAHRAFLDGPLDINAYIIPTENLRVPRRPPPVSAPRPRLRPPAVARD